MLNVVLLFNSRAGSAPLIEDSVRALSRQSHVRVIAVDAPHSETEMRRALERWPQSRWIVAGGDGTVHRLINLIGPRLENELKGIEIGIVPAGTGNDFARSLGAQLGDLEPLCLGAAPGKISRIDLMKVQVSGTDQILYCLNSATGGVGGEIAARLSSDDKRIWGPFAYWVSVVASLSDLQDYHLSLEMRDEHGATLHRDLASYGIVISNGRFIGGGFPISPHAALNDHLLHVTCVMSRPGLELMAAGLVAAAGHAEHSSAIERYRVTRLRLQSRPPMPYSIDGEPSRSIDARFEVWPDALAVRVLHEAPGLIPNSADS